MTHSLHVLIMTHSLHVIIMTRNLRVIIMTHSLRVIIMTHSLRVIIMTQPTCNYNDTQPTCNYNVLVGLILLQRRMLRDRRAYLQQNTFEQHMTFMRTTPSSVMVNTFQ